MKLKAHFVFFEVRKENYVYFCVILGTMSNPNDV